MKWDGLHFVECPQQPNHPDYGVYPCVCDQIVADEREVYEEMLADQAREEGW